MKKLSGNKLYFRYATKDQKEALSVKTGLKKPIDEICNDTVLETNFYIFTRKDKAMEKSACPMSIRGHWLLEKPCKGNLEVCLDIYNVEISPLFSCQENNLKKAKVFYCLFNVNSGIYDYTVLVNGDYEPGKGNPAFYCMVCSLTFYISKSYLSKKKKKT